MAKLTKNLKTVLLFISVLVLGGPNAAHAGGKYDNGASDTEIVVGNFVPYSGPASAYGIVGKAFAAYFQMVNDRGGVNGRKIRFLSYDDAYSAPKAVEQTRRLVEGDGVLLMFGTIGTASNSAVMKYLNARKIPQLLITTGTSKFGKYPEKFPWTMPFNASAETEGRIYGTLIRTRYPNAKIAVLRQNDDYGKDIYEGLREGLGDKAEMIVADATYEITDPTIDSQLVKLKASGADLFVNLSTAKAAAQAIRKLGELNWRPVQILNNTSSSVAMVLAPAGLENAQGIISTTYIVDPSDPSVANQDDVKAYKSFMAKYIPEGDPNNPIYAGAFAMSEALTHILEQAGDNLTHENIMNVAESLNGYAPRMLDPGIRMTTSKTDHFPIKALKVRVFKGDRWIEEDGVISSVPDKP